jgi:hypothetical protein
MELIKKKKEFSIFKKRSGRFCVQNPQNQWIKGPDKTKILLEEGLIKVSPPKKKAEAPQTNETAPTPSS